MPAPRVRDVVLDGFFRGTATSSNGGYAAGVAAGLLGEPAQVSLRKPPPDDQRLGVYLPADEATAVAFDELPGHRPGALQVVGG
jgi:hypothetical protein